MFNRNQKIELDFFLDCKNKSDARKLYLKLCLQLHPDKGGDHDRFVRMQNEYEYVIKILPNEGEEKEKSFESEMSLSAMIEKLCRLRGIEIELCGSWLWITGNTYDKKESLKELNCKFSGNKKAWYWFSGIEEDENRKYRGRKSLDEIRNTYGSEKYFSVSENTQVQAV